MSQQKITSIHFETFLNWLTADRGIVHARHTEGPIYVSTPEQFGGSGKSWNPEQLLLAAIASCYQSTFLYFANKKNIQLNHMECRVNGDVDLVNGSYAFTKLELFATIYPPANTNQDELGAVIKKAEKHCLISNSIKLPVHYHTEVKDGNHTRQDNSRSRTLTGAQC